MFEVFNVRWLGCLAITWTFESGFGIKGSIIRELRPPL